MDWEPYCMTQGPPSNVQLVPLYYYHLKLASLCPQKCPSPRPKKKKLNINANTKSSSCDFCFIFFSPNTPDGGFVGACWQWSIIRVKTEHEKHIYMWHIVPQTLIFLQYSQVQMPSMIRWVHNTMWHQYTSHKCCFHVKTTPESIVSEFRRMMVGRLGLPQGWTDLVASIHSFILISRRSVVSLRSEKVLVVGTSKYLQKLNLNTFNEGQ